MWIGSVFLSKVLIIAIIFQNKIRQAFSLDNQDGADVVALKALNAFGNNEILTAYLPYEILVCGTNVFILHGKFPWHSVFMVLVWRIYENSKCSGWNKRDDIKSGKSRIN